VPPGCGGGVLVGGDTGEFDPAAAAGSGTRDVGLGGTGVWCGGGGRWAPCWVLKEQPGGSPPVGGGRARAARPVVPRFPGFPGGRGVVVVSVLPGMTWGHTGWSSVVGAGGWCFGWVVGWLWVENCTVDASILFSVVCCVWLSCQGRTVDALAPGADEGRGRPR
jgi:hypothetical protein